MEPDLPPKVRNSAYTGRMTIADPGKVRIVPSAAGLRDLSDPAVREQIINEAKRDAQKSVLRARRSNRLSLGLAR